MAKEETEKEPEAPKGGSKKLIIIIVSVVLLLILGGAAAFFLSKDKKGAEDGEEDGGEAAQTEGEEGEGGEFTEAAIMPLETFIVNLQVKGSFLKATIQLEFAEPEIPKTAEGDIPKIRDLVIRIMSSKSSADILSAEGKERLRQELRDGINQVLGAEDVAQVYFTEFIIQ